MGSAYKASPYIQILKPAVNSGPVPGWDGFHTAPGAAARSCSAPHRVSVRAENSSECTGAPGIHAQGSAGSPQPQGGPVPVPVPSLSLSQQMAPSCGTAGRICNGSCCPLHPRCCNKCRLQLPVKETWLKAFSPSTLGSPVLLWSWQGTFSE